MAWEIGTTLKYLFLPPLLFAWLFVFAWLLLRRRPRTARWLLGAGLLLVYLSATSLPRRVLMAEVLNLAPVPAGTPGPQAIVVLGAGRGLLIDANDQVRAAFPASLALERLMTGAQLHKHTGLPVLVTGGSVDGRQPTEAAVMRDALQRDYGVPVRWAEDQSRNTVENARFSARLLKADGVDTVILVTSDFHLKRSRLLFEAQGIRVIPWAALSPVPALPEAVLGQAPLAWRDFWPSTHALYETYLRCNEVAGIAYAYSIQAAGPR